MDNLTHSLVGALLGQTGLKKKTGLAMPALIIGANLPDVDAACFFWLEGEEHLGFRRGITHGPPAIVFLPLVLAALLWGWDRWQASRGKRPESRRPVSFKWLYILSFVGCLSHPALDWLNVYGIRLLEPFSSQWFYGDTLFIIDIWLWLLFGFATWLSLRREKRGGDWQRPATMALALGLAYIGMNAGISSHAAHNHGEAPTGTDTVIASPPPVQFWKRDVIAGGNGLYAINGPTLPGVPLDRCDLASAREASDEIEAFLSWSRTPYVEPREDGTLWLGDARFPSSETGGRFTVQLPTSTCPDVRTEP
ncbi:metal-dependent hydrolase [Qipengyuania sp. DGS5-3]|uniref:metal-dependent hydrolase n=1 Tax=Qipengyuania sp. DGS5-3 TaxID=3349632 RepID=UPI0036D23895